MSSYDDSWSGMGKALSKPLENASYLSQDHLVSSQRSSIYPSFETAQLDTTTVAVRQMHAYDAMLADDEALARHVAAVQSGYYQYPRKTGEWTSIQNISKHRAAPYSYSDQFHRDAKIDGPFRRQKEYRGCSQEHQQQPQEGRSVRDVLDKSLGDRKPDHAKGPSFSIRRSFTHQDSTIFNKHTDKHGVPGVDEKPSIKRRRVGKSGRASPGRRDQAKPAIYTDEDRQTIKIMVDEGASSTEIADKLGRPQLGIDHEIRRMRQAGEFDSV